MTQTSFRDVEQLSALLDEKLNPADVARLQTRLESDPDLRVVYEDLRQTRSLLRRLPQRRAPRNFTLKPSAARVRPPLPHLFPTFRMAAVLASLLFVFSLATNATLPRLVMMAIESPMYAYGMGGGADVDERSMSGDASEEPAMLEVAPAAPAEPAAPATIAGEEEAVEEAVEEPAEKDVEQSATESLDMAEPLADEQRQPYQAEPIRKPAAISPPIPAWIVISLALFAIISGGLAFFLRWQSERRWKTTRKK
jgi:anti-sigma factor RsiW